MNELILVLIALIMLGTGIFVYLAEKKRRSAGQQTELPWNRPTENRRAGLSSKAERK
jgi:hypothetical protein